jgi:hypothetical protein
VRDLMNPKSHTAIDRAYSLSEVPAAMLPVNECHARGKVVIAVTPPGYPEPVLASLSTLAG